MEHPLPITLGLFWIGLLAVGIFWFGMRVYGSRRSAVILMALTTAAFIAGAVIHPFSRRVGDQMTAPVAVIPPPAPIVSDGGGTSGTPSALHSVLAGAGSNTLPFSQEAAIGSVDKLGYVDGKGHAIWRDPVVVPAGLPLLLEGWTVVPSTKAPPVSAFVLVDGERRINGKYLGGTSRPDVARALAASSASNSGFALTVQTAGLAPGAHQLQLVEVDGTQAYQLAQRYDFSIK